MHSLSSQRGAALPETAITISAFVFVVFAGIYLMLTAYRSLGVQFLSTIGARSVALRHCAEVPAGSGTFVADCGAGTVPAPCATVVNLDDRRACVAWARMRTTGSRFGIVLEANPDATPNNAVNVVRVMPLATVGSATTPSTFVGGRPGTVMGVWVRFRVQVPIPWLDAVTHSLSGGLTTYWLQGFAIGRVENA